MELLERTDFLAGLHEHYERLAMGEGHCVFISGEAGIGKTSLVKAFCKTKKSECDIFQGSCDALFTPRPLAPLHDILWQISSELGEAGQDPSGRSELFSRVLHELSGHRKPILLVFEDIHWADEATLDFIKFLARRIGRLRCLFILTYRADEIHLQHPLRNVLGQIPSDLFTRMTLPPLSRQTVEKWALEKGYNGEDVYSISGGNPFYVNEILASYSPGIPDNIKDAILAVYNRRDEFTRQVWQLLSVLPTGFEMKYLQKMDPGYAPVIEQSLASCILVMQDGRIRFKHELYRRTIESSLSPLLRISMNKLVLDLFLESFAANGETERIVHHAKNASDYEVVVRYAPIAARQAAQVGAHQEAAKLYYTAIEYYQGKEKELLMRLYEAYSYECYLIHQMKNAIIYQTKLLKLRQEVGSIEEIGDCMRFLSRLWWYDGHRGHADEFAQKAIETLRDQPLSAAKAMAFSNMSQLNMLSDQIGEAIFWGRQAIAIAQELQNEEILCHALNNVGSAMMSDPAMLGEGTAKLKESLAIALRNGYQEHAARAYTNLGCFQYRVRAPKEASKALLEGIAYCEDMDLGSWSNYMQSWMARVYLETGQWTQAESITERLSKKEGLSPIIGITLLCVTATIHMRKGEGEVPGLLNDAKKMALEANELQRVGPVVSALLEYEWITGKEYLDAETLDKTLEMVRHVGNNFESSVLFYWLKKLRGECPEKPEVFEGYRVENRTQVKHATALWEERNYPYEQALVLFEGDEDDKRKAISIMQGLGATATCERLKMEMRSSGIRSIPRGIRKSTRSNTALLTDREIDVLRLLQEGMQNKEIASKLFISAKTVDHHISAILFKLDVNSRVKAVQEARRRKILE